MGSRYTDLGLTRPIGMPQQQERAASVMDNERKRDLVMEKRLRACSANILQRDRGYFTGPDICTPAIKRQKTPPPSPAAIERAKNPVALRYWNQCVDKSVTQDYDETEGLQAIARNNSNHNINKTLSTAGTGIKRENEVKEALGNINRFIVIDKVKKDDSVRVSRARHRPEKIEVDIADANCKPYNLIKEEQIKLSQERSNFQSNSANRIPNSPKPFRRGVSEIRIASKENICSCNQQVGNKELHMNQLVNEVIPKMNQNQKTQLGAVLLDQLPADILQTLLVKQLSAMGETEIHSVMNRLPDETVSMAVPVLFPRTKDDVKLSLILDSVPQLTKQLRK